MADKYVNIIFTSSDWEDYHRREFTEEIYKQMNKWSSIVIVQLPVSLFVHIFTQVKNKILKLLKGGFKTKEIYPDVYLFTPVILFHYLLWLKFPLFAYIDNLILKLQFEKFLSGKFNSYFRIMWLYIPQLFPAAKFLKYNFLVYDYYDNYDYDYDGNLLKQDSDYHQKLLRKSDFIICTGKKLLERAKSQNPAAYYIPNGNSFSKIAEVKTPKIDFNKKRKIVGYLGTYRNWMDFELLEQLIKKLHDTDFLFIGKIHPTGEESFNHLSSYKNFLHIPFMPFEEVTAYLKLFDVGIIPFKINKFTEGVFPYKFLEYVSAEIPVVTTALPDLEDFSEVIGYSKTNDEFIANVSKGLNGGFEKSIPLYKNIAYENSWQKRVEQLNNLLLNKLNFKLNG